MDLPTEIIRAIIREVTKMPTAFGVSAIGIYQPSKPNNALLDEYDRSLLVKRSLSLVCRRFYSIVEEYLFECIIIEDQVSLPNLKDVLFTPSIVSSGVRTRFIRRLDLICPAITYTEPHRGEVSTNLNTFFEPFLEILKSCAKLEILTVEPGFIPHHNLALSITEYSPLFPRLFWKVLIDCDEANGHLLRHLGVGRCPYHPKDLKEALSHLQGLESLLLSHRSTGQAFATPISDIHSDEMQLQPTQILPRLKSLQLFSDVFEHIERHHILQNIDLTQLQALQITSTAADRHIISIIIPRRLPSVTHFRYEGSARVDLVDIGIQYPRLESLELHVGRNMASEMNRLDWSQRLDLNLNPDLNRQHSRQNYVIFSSLSKISLFPHNRGAISQLTAVIDCLIKLRRARYFPALKSVYLLGNNIQGQRGETTIAAEGDSSDTAWAELRAAAYGWEEEAAALREYGVVLL